MNTPTPKPWEQFSQPSQQTAGDGPWSQFVDNATPSKPKSRGLAAFANDTVIEAANAAAGTASAVGNFISPGNNASKWIDKNIIETGEASQSDVVKAEKARYSQEMQDAQGIGDEVGATLGYAARNPLLAAAQAAGSFAGPGLAVKGAGLAVGAAGFGAKGATRAGLAAGAGLGAAGAGGDAAGTAYDLAKEGGATDEQAVAAARGASVIPAAIGGAGGLVGAERLVAGAKGFSGGLVSRAFKTGAVEGVQEAIEEGVTQYEGQRAAVPFTPDLDPMKGVAGAATMGGVLGGATGAGASVLSPQNTPVRKPSEELGLNPEDGPISKLAAASVDSKPLQLAHNPDSMVSFPDGSVGTQSQLDAYLGGLPEAERVAARARLMGLGAQPADAVPVTTEPVQPVAEEQLTPVITPEQQSVIEQPSVQETSADQVLATPGFQEVPISPETRMDTGIDRGRGGGKTTQLEPAQEPQPLPVEEPQNNGFTAPIVSDQPGGLDVTQTSENQQGTALPQTQAAASIEGETQTAQSTAAPGVSAQFSRGAASDQTQSDAFKAWYGEWQNAGHVQEQLESYGARARTPQDGGNSSVHGLQRSSGMDQDAPGADPVRGITFTGASGPTGADGAPVRFYHGTKDDIAAFDLSHPGRKDLGWLGNGVYLTSNEVDAEGYSRAKSGAHAPNVMPLYANVRNPYEALQADKQRLKHASQAAIQAFTQEVKAKGHDGVVLRDAGGDIELVVFDPAQVKSATGNNGSFDGTNPDIRYSLNAKAVTNPTAIQLRRAMVQRTVDQLAGEWRKRPSITVVDSMEDTRVPEAVREADTAQRSQGAAGEPEGFWYQGQVYLVASALPTSADAARVLYHEVLGHHGLRGNFGEELDSVLDQVAKLRPKDVAAKATEYGLDMSNLEHVGYAAEEVLAELAQSRPDLGLVQRAIAAIRNFLRSHVPGMKSLELTDADIVQGYLLPARGWVERAMKQSPEQYGSTGLQLPSESRTTQGLQERNLDLQSDSVKHDAAGDALLSRSSQAAETFVPSPDGGVDYGQISAEMGKAMRRQAGAIRLRQGNEAWGLTHIEMRHGRDVVAMGYSDARDFVSKVAQGFTKIYSGRGAALDVVIDNEARGMLIVSMEPAADGDFYDIKTATPIRRDQFKNEKPLWVRTGPSAPTVKDSPPYPRSQSGKLSLPPTGKHDNDAPMFSRSQPAAYIASSMGNLTQDQERAYKAVAGFDKVPTTKERWDSFRANFGLRMKQALVDQFAPIAQLDQNAYMLARMSKGSDGTLEAAMLYGRPFLRDGVPDVDMKDGGFANVLAGLKGEHDRFLMWVAAFRAENLKAQGKENLFSDQDITSLKTLNDGQMGDGSSRKQAYAKALSQLNGFNDSVLMMAKDSGLIDQDAYDLMKDQPYVPFYRLMEEEGGLQGPSFSKGLTNQKAWKKLKGGTQQLNADLLQNMLLNWGNLYAASARNRAALAAMDAADKMAVAYKVPSDTKGAAKVMRDGMTEHWMVEDPYLLEAISALNYQASPLMKPLAKAKQWLTMGVTVNPTFKIRNLVRDVISSMAMADLSYNPAGNVAQGWKLTAKDSQVYASMLASGGVIKFGTQEQTDRARKQVAKLSGVMLDQNGAQKLWGQVKALYAVYDDFGDRTENINRAALYDRLIKKGHSHAEASFMARDLMDFSMGGSAPIIRFLTQSVPFLNARMQGLYKLGRAAKEDPRRFATVAMAVSVASLGLLAAYADDEDWKRREDWDRDSYWWFKVGDTAFRIPKPFEVGAIGTLAERTAEAMFSDEMDSQRFMERISHMVSQTFAFDPIPQAVKPLLDIYSNKDSFTGRAIESQADQRLRPQDRYSEKTSEVARFLGQMGLPDPAQLVKGEYTGLSPKQVDHLLRGYFSWVATAATTATDQLVRPMLDRGDRPDMRLKDVFIAGNFVEGLPTGGSRYVSAMYEQSRAVEQAFASYRDALASGDSTTAAEIMESDGDKIRSRASVATATKLLAQLNSQSKRIEADINLNGSEKRERLNQIEQRRHAIAQRVLGKAAT